MESPRGKGVAVTPRFILTLPLQSWGQREVICAPMQQCFRDSGNPCAKRGSAGPFLPQRGYQGRCAPRDAPLFTARLYRQGAPDRLAFLSRHISHSAASQGGQEIPPEPRAEPQNQPRPPNRLQAPSRQRWGRGGKDAGGWGGGETVPERSFLFLSSQHCYGDFKQDGGTVATHHSRCSSPLHRPHEQPLPPQAGAARGRQGLGASHFSWEPPPGSAGAASSPPPPSPDGHHRPVPGHRLG